MSEKRETPAVDGPDPSSDMRRTCEIENMNQPEFWRRRLC